MARSKKLEKNLQKVQDMLDDNHSRKLVVGAHSVGGSETRQVGDTWIDSDGYEWEQKEGFQVKKSSLPAKGIADKCSDCNSFIVKSWDKDVYKANGRCYYCQIDYEAQFGRKIVDGSNPFEEFQNGSKNRNDLSKEEQKDFLDTNLDAQTKYKIGRIENYMEGLKEEEKIWKEEIDKEKVFDKSVANALANSEIDTTNVKLKNNTK